VIALGIYAPILLTRLTKIGAFSVLAAVSHLVLIGWMGTQRIWFLRAFQARGLEPGEAATITRRMFGRYFRLGLLVGVPFCAVFASLHAGGPVGLAVAVLALIVFDVWLTFVPPALAYSTKRATEAVRIGWRMLRREWPRCLWYALAPPLAVVAFLSFLPAKSLPAAVAFVLAVASLMVNLWLKGAVSAYYLRVNPSGPQGSL
jgi:hypothetical protein